MAGRSGIEADRQVKQKLVSRSLWAGSIRPRRSAMASALTDLQPHLISLRRSSRNRHLASEQKRIYTGANKRQDLTPVGVLK